MTAEVTAGAFVSVRIAGKRKVDVELGDLPADATVKDVLIATAKTLGLEGYDAAGVAILADGKKVEPNTPVAAVKKIDAAPKARLGRS
jgi:hypothetical protein